MQLFVLTFTGADRPGIVDQLAGIVRDHGGNWEKGRMASLAGRFAGILLVAVPPDQSEALVAALSAVDGLTVLIEEGAFDPVEEEDTWRLELTGQDRPGIVREISAALVASGANIIDMSTEADEAPMGDGILFRCVAQVVLKSDKQIEGLAGRLEAIANDLLVDIELA
ncbi:MAG: amino acid-binding ACT protein [Proteobacteria bacterium]|nr:amino acid-binding ACT protein [Pseudomonadota bacterium]